SQSTEFRLILAARNLAAMSPALLILGIITVAARIVTAAIAVICPPPPVSEFSVLSYQRLKPGNISVFQDEIKFQCLSPYVLFGNETSVCQADGNWSALPECRTVECSQPEDIENGYIYLLLRRAYRYKETVTYGCNPTYVLDGLAESRCEKTGQWSAKPVCRGMGSDDLQDCTDVN
ncbi:hypothetical protein JD844_011284, partial [Phrynosoma platyrhinos]